MKRGIYYFLNKHFSIIEKIVYMLVGASLALWVSYFISNKDVETCIVEPDDSIEFCSIDVVDNEIEETQIELNHSLYTVYVDAGHGFDTKTYDKSWKYGFAEFGAVGEADYVFGLSNLLVDELKKQGYNVKTLSDFEIDGKKASREFVGNSGRRDLFIDSDCNIMIQLHYDASDDITCRGGHVIYSPMSLGSECLAYSIVRQFQLDNLRLNERYAETDYISKRDNLSVYNKFIEKPLVLVECGYGCEGALDYRYLHDDEVKQRLVKAITKGVNDYFSISFINS